jgi:hypothetical protein
MEGITVEEVVERVLEDTHCCRDVACHVCTSVSPSTSGTADNRERRRDAE